MQSAEPPPIVIEAEAAIRRNMPISAESNTIDFSARTRPRDYGA